MDCTSVTTIRTNDPIRVQTPRGLGGEGVGKRVLILAKGGVWELFDASKLVNDFTVAAQYEQRRG
jgi:hypothetical protein